MLTRTFRFGNVELTRLVDAVVAHPLSLAEMFPGVPESAWQPWRERYPESFATPNHLLIVFASYLLRSEGRTILVDTGVGPVETSLAQFLKQHHAERTLFQLLEQLGTIGVRPEDIDLVVFTHLDADHIGWNVQRLGDRSQLTFPNARYLVHKADWEAFQDPAIRARSPYDDYDLLVTSLKKLEALEFAEEGQQLTSEIALWHTPGHTPGHMSIRLGSGDEQAAIVGDTFVHPAQITEPDWPIFADQDIEAARQTRKYVLERCAAENLTVFVSHFPEPGVGRVVHRDGTYTWQTV